LAAGDEEADAQDEPGGEQQRDEDEVQSLAGVKPARGQLRSVFQDGRRRARQPFAI
jgi:hypothetical protein